MKLTHGTRPDDIATIMMVGMKATLQSDGSSGALCRKEDTDAEASYGWGRTPLDPFSGCFVGVRTPVDDDMRTGPNTSGASGGSGERILVKGPPESAEMPLRVVSVTFRIPSVALRAWREKLRTCLASCIETYGKEQLAPGTRKNAKTRLWMLVAHRLCYDREHASETGKWDRVNRMAYLMHIEIFEAMRPLWFIFSDSAKREAWRQRTWQHLPVPFQEFFIEEHGQAREYFIDDPRINTYDLYSRVRGDERRPPAEAEGHPQRDVRKFAFPQCIPAVLWKNMIS